ncbi:single-stranded DNA-binding protein [Mycoplasma sp. 3686d]|uniref:single-stranded DNA-binding protein n=1 Tax=Mycoplasma sp. 3686d TaxID=2967300 RepID=UPI00211C723A|nr:single-stranded DNA-binding protein [Mycoplasma sp. 3686d]UUM24642.1 single-stranded DNA-binding protein [Mycoplasma sp. 3686d]
MKAKVTLIGRISSINKMTENPSLGKKTLFYNIALTKEGADKSLFYEITAFDKKADFIYKYLEKGDLVHIEGYIEPRINFQTQKQQTGVYRIITEEINSLESKQSKLDRKKRWEETNNNSSISNESKQYINNAAEVISDIYNNQNSTHEDFRDLYWTTQDIKDEEQQEEQVQKQTKAKVMVM